MDNYNLETTLGTIHKYGSVVLLKENVSESFLHELGTRMLDELSSDAYITEYKGGMYIEVYAITLPNIFQHYKEVRTELTKYVDMKQANNGRVIIKESVIKNFEKEIELITTVMNEVAPKYFFAPLLITINKRLELIK